MNGRIQQYFTKDHRRIEDLLEKATENLPEINDEFYHPFRTGLLTHIKMEEKILFPAAQKANGGTPLPIQQQLRLDHGALTSLVAAPPTPEVIKVIKYIMEDHDEKEERPGGMYDLCERLTTDQTQAILEQLKQVTEVPVHPPNTLAIVLKATKRAVARAGYDFDEIVQQE